jgi:hypothetical protein
LLRLGGLYVDIDFECIKSFDEIQDVGLTHSYLLSS